MKVIICDPLSASAVEKMRAAGLDVDVRDTITPEDLLTAIADYDAMVVRSRTKVRKPVLEAAKKLSLVVRGGVGVDNIDVAEAEARGVKVMNTPAASTSSVAELTIAYLFALARPIVQATASMRAGQWEKKKFDGIELSGKTLGIVGLGRIGMAVGERAHALGMKVIGFDSYPVPEKPYLTKVSLDEVWAQADFISLHIPLTESSHHMIGSDVFAKMKTGVRIVDCARGGVIDEDALAQAISSGKVAGAALDVFENEPPTGTHLFELDQVLGSPHVGANTKEATARIGGEVADILIAFSREAAK